MSLVAQVLREFTRDVPLARALLSTFCVALVAEAIVIILALRRGSDAKGTADRSSVKRWRPLLCLFISGFAAIGFPLLARTSLVRSWDRIRGVLSLATGAERAAEYSTAMSALINLCALVPTLVLLIELLACIGIEKSRTVTIMANINASINAMFIGTATGIKFMPGRHPTIFR